MRDFRAVSLILPALGALLATAPALAREDNPHVSIRDGHTACVWNHLPADMQEALKTGSSVIEAIEPRVDDYNAASLACGVKDQLPVVAMDSFAEIQQLEDTVSDKVDGVALERAFMALPADVRDEVTHEWLTRSVTQKADSPLARSTKQALRPIGSPTAEEWRVMTDIEQIAKLIFYEKRIRLTGQYLTGSVACVFDQLPPDVSGDAINAAGEEEPVAPIFESHAAAVANASSVCLIGRVSAALLSEQATITFLVRHVSLLNGHSWSDIDQIMSRLPQADQARLAAISRVQGDLSPDDSLFLQRTALQAYRAIGGVGNSPDNPTPYYILRYIRAKAHVTTVEALA